MTTSSPDTCHAHTSPTSARIGDWLVVFMLFVLTLFLAYSYFDGRVNVAVKASYVWMTPATAVLLLLMTLSCLRNLFSSQGASCHCHGETPRWGRRLLCVAILLTPIAFSLTVNPRGLSMEGSRKRRTPAPALNADFHRAVAWVLGEAVGSENPDGADASLPPQPTVLDVFAAAGNGGAAGLEGQFVTLEGQCDSYGGPDAERFDLYRLVVTCCIADASSVALEVARPPSIQLESGAWIRAAGILKFDSQAGSNVPVLHATIISRIPEPSSPYL